MNRVYLVKNNNWLQAPNLRMTLKRLGKLIQVFSRPPTLLLGVVVQVYTFNAYLTIIY